ncbi:MAG: hypothetical protein V4687_16460 [Bacteroidota bacterium]
MKTALNLIAIRFTFLLSIAFILCFNNGSFYFLDWINSYITSAKDFAVNSLNNNLLHLNEVNPQFNGSGDTTYAYVLLLGTFLFAVIGTIIWSVLDRKRKSHNHLLYWLIVTLRFYVGFMLVHYGLAKLNNGQFPGPSATGMMTTYGDSSPMGLAWRFLGFSEGYKTFMFIAEMMGVLLFFRKTATIGAILCLMTCVNIMAINYFFDVPVKLLSTSLVVMCLIILSPNLIRLFKLFFKGETIKLDLLQPPAFKAPWAKVGKEVVKYLAIALCALVPAAHTVIAAVDKKSDANQNLYGAYRISAIDWPNGTPNADSTFLSHKWQLMVIDSRDRATIRFGEDEIIYCKTQIDNKNKTIKLSFNDEPGVRYTLSYRLPVPGVLELRGELFGKVTKISLSKKEFNLTKQGFRWINEYPDNK